METKFIPAVLDDPVYLKNFDPSRTLDSVSAFPDQLKTIWKGSQAITFPEQFRNAGSIVLSGMGGSALGGKILKSLFSSQLKVPFEVVTEYDLPGFVDEKTLVIIASYSGNTEETISTLRKAKEKGAMVFAVTTGGKIGEEVKKGLTGMVFSPVFNYLGFPKTALGYSLGAIAGLLSKAGFIDLSEEFFNKSLADFLPIQKTFLPEMPLAQNPAKQLSVFLKGKIGVLIASEHLNGPAVAFRNQMNEIAHSFCLFFALPEMNHHLIEAFANPAENKESLGLVFLKADNYFSRNIERYSFTREILSQMEIKTFDYRLASGDPFVQSLEVVQLGGFVSTYLSLLNQQDPGPEKWIIKLKEKLASAHDK